MIEFFYWFLILFGVLFSLLRIILGPKIEDRVAALDGLNVMVSGIIVLLAFQFKNSIYLDVALVYAVLAFLETVIFSRILEKKKELK
ncbi:MAG TPA: cation:proton antiporter [Candidatus Mcinerneyibacterium sp.]|nr:cation:proton antiporter [Candidatus Mcinerneyibacterium sp.]